MKPSFTLFGVTVYPYSILMVVGASVCLGLFSVLSLRRRRGGQNAYAVEALILSMAAALPAAMIFDSCFHWIETGVFVFGGATFYGGLLFALALFPLLLGLQKGRSIPISVRLNDLAPAVALGHAIGRIGCFFGGCCFGKPTGGNWGVVFPEGSAAFQRYGNIPVHPTQLYEAAFLVLLFLFLLRKKTEGFPLYLILYGAWRLGVEFLRGDDRGSLFGALSPAQTISILLIVTGITLIAAHRLTILKKRKSRTL